MQRLSNRKRWETEEVKLCVLSPLVVRRMSSFDHVEMRIPSLKGMLRFWWRALQGHQTSVEAIREREGALFGAAGTGKSPMRMALMCTTPTVPVGASQVFLLPHKEKGKTAYFPPFRTPFVVRVTAPTGQLEEYLHLLRTALFLGGLGARGRRGFGSLHLDPPPRGLEEICDWLNRASGASEASDPIFAVETAVLAVKDAVRNEYRQVTVKRIILRKENPALPFPYVREVYLGDPLPLNPQAVQKWLARISYLSSDHNSLYTGYTAALAGADPDLQNLMEQLKKQKQARLASPLVTTLALVADRSDRKTLRPVVVRLKSVFPPAVKVFLAQHQKLKMAQDTTNAFILDVLSGGIRR